MTPGNVTYPCSLPLFGVQAHIVPLVAIPTFGESWHNNHHAFPASTKHGLYRGQIDLGWHFVQLLERTDLARDVRLPSTLPPREGITAIREGAEYVMYSGARVPTFCVNYVGLLGGRPSAWEAETEMLICIQDETT